MEKQRKTLLYIIDIALFTSLSFGATYLAIPFGVSKIHLGNFVCLLASLLLGPWIGGISGALGMSMNDIACGYPWTTFVRTFVLKFLMGMVAGGLFRFGLKRKRKGTMELGISTLCIAGCFAFSLAEVLKDHRDLSLATMIAFACLLGLFVIAFAISFWLKPWIKVVLFSLTIALLVNVVGEFFLRILFSVIMGTTFSQAMALSFAKLPASLFTSVISLSFASFAFYRVYLATRRHNPLNDLDPYLVSQKQ